LIDLHLHTTASDGQLAPAELVARAAATGLTTISVTDHDTVAGVDEALAAGQTEGLRVVPGIEVTSVDAGRDVHVLGYFIDAGSAALAAFLKGQRARRVERVNEIGDRLARLGKPIDVKALLDPLANRPGASVGRPQVARALVAAGHVSSVRDAFDRLLATGRPAFVPRTGPTPAEAVAMVHAVGGLASLAHPGLTRRDDLIAPLAARGLDALEVFHSDHSPDDERVYGEMADRLDLLVTGGSDFHGEEIESRAGRDTLGAIVLPADAFARLEERAVERRAGS
jgi:hypothetical protein